MRPMASSHHPRNPVRAHLAASISRLSCILAAAVLLHAPSSAQAAGPGWTANSTVTKVVVTGDGGVNVHLSPALSGCTSNSGYGQAFASIYPSHPGINRMKADLLAAYLTGGTVALYLTDNTCRVGELILGGW